MSNDENFFDKFGMEVKEGKVEVGQTYPLYGMITKILDENIDNFTVELNHGITLHCSITSQEAVDKIKERAFEPGIFITEVTKTEPVEGHCSTIIFGRSETKEV